MAEQEASNARPAWRLLKGVQRVQAELRHLAAAVGSQHGFIKELSVPDDDICVWQLKLRDFDTDTAGGRQLNQDLARLQQQYGQDHILMEIMFPDDYPTHPFFVRVVSPRCVMYTGHVTAGGSICLEALTCSSTPGSWQPDFSVDSLMNSIMINMIDCPVTLVQTLTGPGGVSGPLRVDFSIANPCSPYSRTEAQAAFRRTVNNHARLGWGTAGGAGGARPSGFTGAAGHSGTARYAGMPMPPAATAAPHRAPPAAATVAASSSASIWQSSAVQAGPALPVLPTQQQQQQQQGPLLAGTLPEVLPELTDQPAEQPSVLVTPQQIKQFKVAYARYLGRKARELSAGPSAVPAAGGRGRQRKRVRAGTAELDVDGSNHDGGLHGGEHWSAPAEAGEWSDDEESRQRRMTGVRRRIELGLPATRVWDGGRAPAQQQQAEGHQAETARAAAVAVQAADAAGAATGSCQQQGGEMADTADVQLPPHWDAHPALGQVDGAQLVQLDLTVSLGHVLVSAAAATHVLDRACRTSLARQGLTRLDSLAALLLEGGDQEHAMLRAFVYAGQPGKVVEVWRNRCLQEGSAALTEDQLTTLRRKKELDDVLEHLVSTSDGTITRDRVVKVERIQNPALWRRYMARRDEIITQRGEGGLNERLLFHGTSCAAVGSIAWSGFNADLSCATARFGRGIYFADRSVTSLPYCGSAAGAAHQAMPWPWPPVAAAQQAPPPPASSHLKMIVARVALGEQSQGYSGMQRALQAVTLPTVASLAQGILGLFIATWFGTTTSATRSTL